MVSTAVSPNADRAGSRATWPRSRPRPPLPRPPAPTAVPRPRSASLALPLRQVDPHDGGIDRGCDPQRAAPDGDGVARRCRRRSCLRPCSYRGSTCATCGPGRPRPTATRRRTPVPSARPRHRSSRPRSSRSIRETVPSSRFATHTEPSPAATACGPCPTRYSSVIRPPSGSISPTWSSPMPDRLVRLQHAAEAEGDDAGDHEQQRGDREHATRRAARADALRGSAGVGEASSSAGSWARIASLESTQLGARLDPDLLDQRRTRLAVGLERLGLAAGAIERQHPLRVQPLAQRMLRRSAPRARRSPRRGGLLPGRRRSPARPPARAARRAAGSQRRRTARRPVGERARRATARAPRAARPARAGARTRPRRPRRRRAAARSRGRG